MGRVKMKFKVTKQWTDEKNEYVKVQHLDDAEKEFKNEEGETVGFSTISFPKTLFSENNLKNVLKKINSPEGKKVELTEKTDLVGKIYV